MTVGPNMRISAAPAGEAGAAAPAESGGIDEIFGDIIAGLAAGAVQGPTAEQGVPAATQGAIEPEAGEAGVDALIEQLLAFAAGAAAKDPSGGTGTPEEGSDPEQEDEVPVAAEEIQAVQPVFAPEIKAVAVDTAVGVTLPTPAAAGEAQATAPEIPAATAPTVPVAAIPAVPTIPAMAGSPTSKPIVVAATIDSLPAATSHQVALEPKLVPDQPAKAAQPPVVAGRLGEPGPQQPLQATTAAPEQREPLPASLDPLLKAAPAIASFLRLSQEGSSEGVTIAPDHEPLAPLTLVQSSAPAFPTESIQPTTFQPVKLEVVASPEPADLGVEHQLDMAHEGEWLDRLAKDIAQSAGSDSQPLRFRLNPETLGSLRVEISQDRNGAAVRLTADTEAARAIIAEAQPRLIAEARAQGIRISEAHVDVGSHTASGDQRRQNGDFEEVPLRTARSLQEHGEGDGNPTPGRSERYA